MTQERFEQNEQQGIEEEKAYGDSSAAVTPDTQQPPQGGDQFGESSQGESTVFGEPQPDEQRGNVEGQTSNAQNQDAAPSETSFEQ